MANIAQLLDQLSIAVYGKDVRQTIIDAIQKCYEDASTSGNANIEVIESRGTFSTLGKRLDSITSSIANTLLQMDELEKNDVRISTIQSAVESKILSLIEDGTLAAMEISDGTIGKEKLTLEVQEILDKSENSSGTPESCMAAKVSGLSFLGNLPITPNTDSIALISDSDCKLTFGTENFCKNIGNANVTSGNNIIDGLMVAEYINDYSVRLTETQSSSAITNYYKTYQFTLAQGLEYTISANVSAGAKFLCGNGAEGDASKTADTEGERLSMTFVAASNTVNIKLHKWDKSIESVLFENIMLCAGTNTVFSTGVKTVDLAANTIKYINGVKGIEIPAYDGTVIKAYQSPNAVISINGKAPDESGNINLNTQDNEGKNFVFFGDSIIAFGANTGGIGSIPDYMAQYCGGNWFNFALGGTTLGAYRSDGEAGYDAFTLGEWADSVGTGDFTKQEAGIAEGAGFSSETLTIAKTLEWDSVDTIFIAFGTNDIAYGNEVGTTSDSAQKNGTICASLKYAINTMLAARPFAKIVVMGVIYRYADGISTAKIMEVNEAMKEICNSMGIRFADMFAAMTLNVNNRTSFLYDGTHPNANGKIRYAETMKNILNL